MPTLMQSNPLGIIRIFQRQIKQITNSAQRQQNTPLAQPALGRQPFAVQINRNIFICRRRHSGQTPQISIF
jgi:hypothetical protein